jgi:hypothetical protein
LTVTPRDLDRDRLRHRDQAGLRGGVVGLAGVGAQPDDGGDVDDPPPARLQHRRDRAARRAERGRQVRVEHDLPVVVLDLRREAVGAHAGVVDEHEHGAEALFERGEVRIDPLPLHDVAAERERTPAGRLDLRDDRRGGVRGGVVADADGPAVGREALRDRRADPARGAGDERAAVGALRHGRLRASRRLRPT